MEQKRAFLDLADAVDDARKEDKRVKLKKEAEASRAGEEDQRRQDEKEERV